MMADDEAMYYPIEDEAPSKIAKVMMTNMATTRQMVIARLSLRA